MANSPEIKSPTHERSDRHRRRGDGSLFKRGDLWVVTVSGGLKLNGQRQRSTVYCKTFPAAQKRLAELQRDKHNGLPLPSGHETLGAFLWRWFATRDGGVASKREGLDESVGYFLKPKTLYSYRQLVGVHIEDRRKVQDGKGNPIAPIVRHEIANVRLHRLTPEAVQKFLADKLREGLSPRTVQYLHAILKRAIKDAERWGLVARNAAAVVPGPQVPKREVEPLTLAEAKALLAAAVADDADVKHGRGARNMEALCTLAVGAGLRIGECLGLRWQDVDLEACRFRVQRTLERVDKRGPRLSTPKTDRSRALTDMGTIVADALRKRRAQQAEERLAAGRTWKAGPWGDLIFTSENGAPLFARNVNRSIKRLQVAAKITRRMSFHTLRHTCASIALEEGVSMRAIADQLRHQDPSMTARVYAHVSERLASQTATAINAALTRA